MDERYELAFKEVKSALDLQDDTLANLRTRATALLSTATVLSTFAAAVGLIGSDPSKGNVLDDWIALTLVGIVIGIGACTTIILFPSKGWVFGLNAEVLVKSWIEAKNAATIDDMHRYLALDLRKNEESNRRMMERRFNAYRVGILLLVIETIVLVAGFTFLG